MYSNTKEITKTVEVYGTFTPAEFKKRIDEEVNSIISRYEGASRKYSYLVVEPGKPIKLCFLVPHTKEDTRILNERKKEIENDLLDYLEQHDSKD